MVLRSNYSNEAIFCANILKFRNTFNIDIQQKYFILFQFLRLARVPVQVPTMELRQSMNDIVFILRLCGGFPPLKESKWYKPYWCCCGIVTIICGLLFVFSNYFNVVFATDFDEIANSLYMSIEHSAALVKICSLLYFNGLVSTLEGLLFKKLQNNENKRKYLMII